MSRRVEEAAERRMIAVVPSERQIRHQTVIGYKKIAGFDLVRTKKLIIEILDARIAPTLSFVGLYR